MKKLMCMILLLALGLSIVTTPALASSGVSFSDVPSTHWAYGSIQTMADMGIVGGVGGGKFDPNGKVSTAQFAAMVVRAFYADEQEGRTSNVDKWWAVSMSIAQDRNLVRETTAGKTYKTDNETGAESWNIAAVEAPMTRADMAIVLTYTMDRQGMAAPSAAELEATRAKIADYNTIADNYKDAVTIAYNRGLLKGVDSKGSFNPNGQLTRAEACAVLERMLQQMGMIESKPADTTPSTPVDTTPTTPSTPADNTSSSGYKEGYLANGQPITEDNIKAMLEELRSQYPEGMEWGLNDSYSSPATPAGYNNNACAGFAWMLSDKLFGTDATVNSYYKHQDFDSLKVGDVLWIKSSNTGYNHAVVIISVDGDNYRACSGNVGGKVSWEDNGDISFLKSDTASKSVIFSRY